MCACAHICMNGTYEQVHEFGANTHIHVKLCSCTLSQLHVRLHAHDHMCMYVNMHTRVLHFTIMHVLLISPLTAHMYAQVTVCTYLICACA
jgi:hypothetical protein